MPGRLVHVFRALFPSWKFFDDPGAVPHLFVRVAAQHEYGTWRACLAQPRRRPWHILINVEANFYLAACAVLEHLLSDLEELSDEVPAQDLVSYRLVRNLVCEELRAYNESVARYQFKITLAVPGSGVGEDVLISPSYRVAGAL